MSRRLAVVLCVLVCAIPAAAATRVAGRLPIAFEPSEPATGSRFFARGLGYSLFINDSEAVAVVGNDAVRIGFSGAHRPVSITGEDPMPGRANYFIGSDPSKWRTDVPMFRRVVAHDVYDGIDLVYYGAGDNLEYDFVVHPGADPKQIQLSFRGTDRIEQDAAGDLVLHLAGGTIRQRLPVVYQQASGRRTRLRARYTQTGSGTFAFDIARFDRKKELVIDPEIGWSTLLGGNGSDLLNAIAVDAVGNNYVAGTSDSTAFSTLTPFRLGPGTAGAFVAKFDPTGSYLIYVTYLGSGNPLGLAVNAAGEAFVAGFTYSADFPTTPHAFQTLFIAGSDGFVTRINSVGNALVYSTLIGRGTTALTGIGVDAADNAHVAGITDSQKYPTIGAIQPTMSGFPPAAVFSILNATGTGLLYSTYLGDESTAPRIVVDSSGNSYLTGSTGSSHFPTTPGSFKPALNGGGWVAKFSADNALVYATYLGPLGGPALAVDPDGNAYVAGSTRYASLPVTPGVFQPSFNGGGVRSFVMKLNPSGTALVYATYLGGSNDDEISGIAADAGGNAYVTGNTLSRDFPIVNGIQRRLDGIVDAFVTKIDPAGHSILFSTFLGGSNSDGGSAIHVNAAGDDIRIAGSTYSSDFPTIHSLTPSAATPLKADWFVTSIVIHEPVSPPRKRSVRH